MELLQCCLVTLNKKSYDELLPPIFTVPYYTHIQNPEIKIKSQQYFLNNYHLFTIINLICISTVNQKPYFFLFFFETGLLCLIALDILELALVDQAGLKIRDPPACVSRVLGLKVCTTTTRLETVFKDIKQKPLTLYILKINTEDFFDKFDCIYCYFPSLI